MKRQIRSGFFWMSSFCTMIPAFGVFTPLSAKSSARTGAGGLLDDRLLIVGVAEQQVGWPFTTALRLVVASPVMILKSLSSSCLA
jgi:hypothetical protein